MKLKELKPYLKIEHISIIDICHEDKKCLFKLHTKNDLDFNYYSGDNYLTDMYDIFGESTVESIEDNIIYII